MALADGEAGTWDSAESLGIIVSANEHGELSDLAAKMARACSPIAREKLIQRLGLVGMTMAPNRPTAEATAWVHETARLLADLPEDIVFEAIDQHQKTNKFLPAAAEIRAIADPRANKRRTQATRLDCMTRYLASGQPIPCVMQPRRRDYMPAEVDEPMTPAEAEEMNAIMARVGAATRYYPDGKRYEVETTTGKPRHLGPARKPTRADYIALGVDPAVLDQMEAGN